MRGVILILLGILVLYLLWSRASPINQGTNPSTNQGRPTFSGPPGTQPGGDTGSGFN